MSHSLVTALTFLFSSALCAAQLPGVVPAGATDVQTDQLRGNVLSVNSTTWDVDFSRHEVEKTEISQIKEVKYDPEGGIESVTTKNNNGLRETKTIYQYGTDGNKRVSTTYTSSGERTLQTLYAYTADGYLARMRFTDATAVTISTTEVSTTESWTQTQETFKDGEIVTTTFHYDANFNLLSSERNDGKTQTTLTYKLGRNGLPLRIDFSASDGTTHVTTFDYTTDATGNWTTRTTYVDGTATEYTERTISYY